MSDYLIIIIGGVMGAFGLILIKLDNKKEYPDFKLTWLKTIKTLIFSVFFSYVITFFASSITKHINKILEVDTQRDITPVYCVFAALLSEVLIKAIFKRASKVLKVKKKEEKRNRYDDDDDNVNNEEDV